MKFRHLASAAAALMFTTVGAKADTLNTKAEFAYIMDGDTGAEIYSKRGEEPMIPASMTKIMTVYLVFERIRDGRLSLDDEFTVSENAWRKGGAASGSSTMFLEPGSKVSVSELLQGVVVQSGNDACIVLAEGVSGSEEAFAAAMTERARELGLTTASFKNVTGLNEEGHEISAEDLAKIALLTIQDFPEFYEIYSQENYTWNDISQPNRNPLLRDVDGADGLKTGHLEISGYGLVGSAVRNGERRIIVINGLGSMAERASEAQRVMRAAFVDFKRFTLVDAGAEVGEAKVWMGVEDTVGMAVDSTITRIINIDSARKLSFEVQHQGPVKAPITKGQEIGELVITGLNEELRLPLYATSDVAAKGFLDRVLMGAGFGN